MKSGIKIHDKIPVGILGATGTVGRRLVSLLGSHPWFRVTVLAASSRSAGKTYAEAVADSWEFGLPIPPSIARLPLLDASAEQESILRKTRLVFSALKMDKAAIKTLEEGLAASGQGVVTLNSAHRLTPDIPILLPEVNPQHTALIDIQRKNRGWKDGFIAAKPNCSVQSFVPILEALKRFELEKVMVSTCQAVSGAGRKLDSWPQMHDNVIPYIDGEEIKTEQEPLKIWGTLGNDGLVPAIKPVISSTCLRVPVSDGHLAVVHVGFGRKPSQEDLLEAIRNFQDPLRLLDLPSSPKRLLTYFDEPDRPQTALDRLLENGMGIAIGRLREDSILDWKFVALSHNTIRGAAGGAILMAELLLRLGYVVKKPEGDAS